MDTIPPNSKALTEALALSEDLLRNIELNEIPLTNIALKASRLSRLLNEFDYQKIFEFEAGGYPTAPDGIPPDVYALAVMAGREIIENGKNPGEKISSIYYSSIDDLSLSLDIVPTALEAAKDPSVSMSQNPVRSYLGPQGNSYERKRVLDRATMANSRLASRRSFIYKYVLSRHYELKFSGVADDIFARIRGRVDLHIGNILPESIKRFSSVYENMLSDNSENWSNAVHSCRRILQDLADAVCPAQADSVKLVNGKSVTIKLDATSYINRIIHFVESKSDSERFQDIVGSNLQFVGDRLDSVFKAAQKGSHHTIVKREEADRYVAYTYMLIGDIISLV